MAAQGDFSDYVVHAELDFWFGGTDKTPPANLYVGLSTKEAHNLGGTVTEPAGNGYARVTVPNNTTNWPAASGRTKSNGIAIVFPAPTGLWGKIVSWFITDTLAGTTNVIASGTLTAEVTIDNGQPAPRFAVGALVLHK